MFVHNKHYCELSLLYPFFHIQHKLNQPEKLRLKDNSKFKSKVHLYSRLILFFSNTEEHLTASAHKRCLQELATSQLEKM